MAAKKKRRKTVNSRTRRARRTTIAYRDKRTGRFVKKATWKRSRARGGKRYLRENPKLSRSIKRRSVAKARPARPIAQPQGEELQDIQTPLVVRDLLPVTIPTQEDFEEFESDFFESGYEAPDEEEYA